MRRKIECILALVILVVAGCANIKPYHELDPSIDNCVDPFSENCNQSYYQKHPDYDLAFAEFTERGNAYDSHWIDNVLDNIRVQEREHGIIVIAFIHGWKHNAKETDANLLDFKKSLKSIADSSSTLYKKRVIGLYIGWKGASLDIPWVENLTFWDRKNVAEEVGKGGITKLLLELDQIDKADDDNVLVVIGHSFGGAIIVSAMTEVLAERVIHRPENETPGIIDFSVSIGDAVIVLNPAIEANQSLNLVESAIQNNYPADQNPLFISISSDADAATHYIFPIGQTLGLLFTWNQLDLERSYYYDRLSNEHLVLKEEHLNATTVGNFAPFLTHKLVADSTGEVPTLVLQTCDQAPDECMAKGLTTLSGYPTIGPLPDNYPLYFIRTDKTVMKNHNDIFNPVVRAFIMSVIDDIVHRANITIGETESAPAPILSDPEKLNESFQKFYSAGVNP